MALPSIRKYLERAVMVEISKIPEANNGQPIVEPIVTPAITFCPFKNLKSVEEDDSESQIDCKIVAPDGTRSLCKGQRSLTT